VPYQDEFEIYGSAVDKNVLVDGNQALALHFDSLPLDATMEPEKQ
jgi:hypothetical protein